MLPPCSRVYLFLTLTILVLIHRGGLNRRKNRVEWCFGQADRIGSSVIKMPPFSKKSKQKQRKQSKTRVQVQKKDPLMAGGQRPRPMFVDYKDVELLKKLTSRQGKILSRRKSGCSAISQHAVAVAIKRARFMALLPYVAD